MHELAPLIYDLAVMLGFASIVVILFQRIHQPVVLGYLVVGMIIGPFTPPHSLVNDIANIQILSQLGVIFLMFSLGLEFSFQKLTRVGFSASVIGFIEVILMVLIGYLTGLALGWSYYDCLFLGAALSISSTTIIIKAIEELNLKTKRFAELIFGVLIVEDLLAILLLVALSTIVITRNIFSYDMISATMKLILVVGGWFLVGYFLMPPLFRRIAGYISQETLTIISVALCLFLVCVAASFDYSTALGAFIMGSILAETVLVHRIEKLIAPIRDIFAAVFFISVGMLINPLTIINNWSLVLLIAFITIFGKLITTSVAALLTGQSINTSVRVGFSMAQIGEFSFIIAALGLSLKVTTNKLYPLIVAVSAITTFTTPYLIRFSGYIVGLLEKYLPENIRYFLDNYSNWVFRTQTVSNKNPFFKTVAIRLLSNGIVVAIIFTLVHYFVYHKFELFPEGFSLANVLFLLLTLALASPFIWGMLFSYKKIKMPQYAKSKLNPAIFIIWLLTLSEISFLSIAYFHSWFIVSLFLVIALAFFIFAYRHLEASYHWFETQLVSNIKLDHQEGEKKYRELAPWDTHLVEIEVGEGSHFSEKTLSECQIREKFDVNIVAICHGSRVIAAPRGDERIVAHDTLIVLGNDVQIDLLRKEVETINHGKEMGRFLDNFTLRAFVIADRHSYLGKTIRQSKIREHVNGLVVGLERDNKRILNPDPDTKLKLDDLLLIVGEVGKIEGL